VVDTTTKMATKQASHWWWLTPPRWLASKQGSFPLVVVVDTTKMATKQRSFPLVVVVDTTTTTKQDGYYLFLGFLLWSTE
jgi:hypothetical protein